MFNPFANLFTAPGLNALLAPAVADSVTTSPAPAAANPALGGGTVAPGVTATLTEPSPDQFSGYLGQGLGDKLTMRSFSTALFDGDPDMHEPVQGFLENCPLAAVMCAMAHVPKQRARLKNDIIKTLKIPVSSQRIRRDWEYFVGSEPSPLPTVGPFATKQLHFVTFARSFAHQKLADTPGAEAQIRAAFASPNAVPVSDVLHVNTNHGGLHYMHTFTGAALWPCIIEKAYAVGRGHNSYDNIRHDVGLAEAMRDMTGAAEEEHLVAGPGDTLPAIKDKALKSWLDAHATRPTIMGSIDSAPHPNLVQGHTYAVVGWDGTDVTLIDALENTAAARLVKVPFGQLRANMGEIVRGPA